MAVFDYEVPAGDDSGGDTRFMTVGQQHESARVTIPAEMASNMGIEPGDKVAVQETENGVEVRPV